MGDSQYYREIREKREILRDRYGGMMTLDDLMHELGYDSPKPARKLAKEVQIPVTRIGQLKKYDTDIVAKALVDGRGMA